jgi:hypothetical protein
MKSFLIKFFVGFTFIFVQLLLRKFFAHSYFTPNMLMIFYGFLSYLPLSLSSLYAVFTVALVADLTAGLNLLGPSAIAGVIVYLSISFAIRNLLSDRFLAIALGFICAATVFNLLYIIVLGSESLNVFDFLPKLLLNGLANGMLAGLVLYFGKQLVAKQTY